MSRVATGVLKTPSDQAYRSAINNLVEKGGEALQILIKEKRERILEIRKLIEKERRVGIRLNRESLQTDMDTPRCYINYSSTAMGTKRFKPKQATSSKGNDDRIKFGMKKSPLADQRWSTIQSNHFPARTKRQQFQTTKDWRHGQQGRVSIMTQSKPHFSLPHRQGAERAHVKFN